MRQGNSVFIQTKDGTYMIHVHDSYKHTWDTKLTVDNMRIESIQVL